MDQMEYEYYEADEDGFVEYRPTQVSTTKFVKVSRMPMIVSSSASSGPPATYNIRDRPPVQSNVSSTSSAVCAVCGDGQAKLHYGVLACYGCKGFFRRTLAGKYRYNCRFGNNCIVDKFQRNSCRYCRFQRCIEVGMDPKAVRPDRDLTGKQRMPRLRKKQIDEDLLNHMMRLNGDDWSRKLQMEVRVLLMRLMSIEAKVVKGEESSAPATPQIQIGRDNKVSLREMFEQKPTTASRSLMGYEPYRMAKPEELAEIAHRRAIAAVDWVDSLTEIAELAETEDKVALVKSGYSPLTIFNFSARTAQNTKNPDILCLCSHSYVPRQLPAEFNETNHLSNVLIDRTLNELVAPMRKLNLKEEEIVPLKAIIILNPNTKGLSLAAKQAIGDLRDKVQDMLFQICKELHPVYTASSRFGNLLLLLPTITTLSGLMSENMQFCQAFGGRQSGDPLLSEMFGDFKFNFDDTTITSSSVTPPLFENPAEISLQSISPPLLDSPGMVSSSGRRISRRDAETQTEEGGASSLSQSRSSNSLIGGGYSPPMCLPSVSMSSPFDTLSLLDDDISTRDINLVDLGHCDDFLNLINS